MKILVTPTSFKPNSATPASLRLAEFADELVFNDKGRPLEEDELIELVKDCDGYIAGLDFITERVILAAGRLRVISRYGVGVDRVDLDAAKSKGIAVCNTPAVNSQAVADLAIGLALSVARRLPMLDKKTKQGEWVRSTGCELYSKTMGIMGLGAIGRGVAKRAQGFSMKVVAYDPYMNADYAASNGIEAVDFDRLVELSDFVSLHLPLTPQTKHILSYETMRSMKRGAIIVNTARGGLIDESAAARLIEEGHIGGLGLDAFEQEPPRDNPLLAFDNVVVTPHTGAHTFEAIQNMAHLAVDNLIRVLSGEECGYLV